jgi:hypothetical protein
MSDAQGGLDAFASNGVSRTISIVVLLVVVAFSGYRAIKDPPLDLFLPGTLRRAHVVAVFPAVVLFVLAAMIVGVENEPGSGTLAERIGEGWSWLALVVGVGAVYAIGGLAVAALAVLAPTAYGLGRWLGPTFTSAGSARYWLGASPDDRVIRIPVGGYGTLAFKPMARDIERLAPEVEAAVTQQLAGLFPRRVHSG